MVQLKIMRFFIPLLLAFCALAVHAQNPFDLAIPVTVTTISNPTSVTLSWPAPLPAQTIVRRRVKGTAGNNWTDLVNQPNSSLTQYVDASLSSTQMYEYEVVRTSNGVTASGSAFASFLSQPVDYRGKILIVIDSITRTALGQDFNVYQNNLRGEGWEVITIRIGPSATVQSVRAQIANFYNADPQNTKTVLLVGQVPVPYSGNTAFDGRPDHMGAWPTDAYYGDINGTWTDNQVNNNSSPRPATRNIPNDGKFDQSTIPSEVELAVGRLDFRRLQQNTFGTTPTELLRRYFQKNNRWRTGQYSVPNSGIIDDEWGTNTEGPAADGWRNAFPLLGIGSVTTGEFSNPQRRLWAYGAGATAGSFVGAPGVMTSANFAVDSFNTVIAGLYGEYIGDWDFETNPLLPAGLASRGGLLATGWMGRPRWQLQGLAINETMGFCLRETQNAALNTAYGTTTYESAICINLLGDPTVRAQVVPAPVSVTVQSNCTEMKITWAMPANTTVDGFVVYRSATANGRFLRVSQGIVTGNQWFDSTPLADSAYYQVRAIRTVTTPGGGQFYINSTSPTTGGRFVQGAPPSVIATGGSINCTIPSVVLGANFQPPASTFQWFRPDGTPLSGAVATSGGTYSVIVTSPTGCTASATALVQQDTFLPIANLPNQVVLNCANPVFLFNVPAAYPNVLYYFNDVIVQPGGNFSVTGNSVFRVYSFDNGCTDVYTCQVSQDFQEPDLTVSDNGPLSCATPVVQISASSTSIGSTFVWTGNITQPTVTVAQAGNYCVTVTSPNGCTRSSCTNITSTVGSLPTTITSNSGNCNTGTPITLTANPQGGVEPYAYVWPNGVTTQTYPVPSGFTGSILVQVSDQSGCSGLSTYTVAAPFTGSISASPSPCTPSNGPTTLTATPIGGAAPYQYAWSNGATSSSTSVPNGFVGTMQVSITDQNNCVTSKSITLGVGFTAAVFYTLPSSPTATDGSINTTLFSGDPAVLSYQWSNGATTTVITGLSSGTYTVTISDLNGCTQVLTVPLIVSDTKDQEFAKNAIKIAPNPAHDRFRLEWVSDASEEAVIRIFDAQGIEVYHSTALLQPVEVLVPNLPAGLYLLSVEMGSRRYYQRVLIH
jgi:Secretion system C-terminal sorting domain